MKPSELKDRTRKFSVAVIKLQEKIPKTIAGNAAAEPLLKAGLTVGVKYRLTCKALNPYDFINNIGAAEEAADECLYWLDLMIEAEMLPAETLQPVRDEARKLRRIFTKSRRSANKRQRGETYRKGPRGDEDIPF